MSPHELESAIAAIARFSERKDAYDRLGRKVVPMEVGHIESLEEKVTPPPMQETVSSLTATVKQLNSKVAKMEASARLQTGNKMKSVASRNLGSQVRPATVECYRCGKKGHFARQCTVRSPNTRNTRAIECYNGGRLCHRQNDCRQPIRQPYMSSQQRINQGNQGNGQTS